MSPADAGRDEAWAQPWGWRLLAGVLLLAAVAFRQAGGRVVPDTKLDLTVDPGGFLQRALSMWDPAGQFGQLQNQAYGYLLPAGPFHWALTGLGVPAWIVQRCWWTTVMAVAFLGMWRLGNALAVGRPWSRYVAALLYALSPRMLGEVAITSVEVWPYAMAPWVLAPLVDPRSRSRAWRVSRSALAVALTGGVNAVATGAVLVLPTIWFATRALDRGRWRRSLHDLAGWLTAVTVVSLWWLVPLVLLGRYSPPFLDWIENAAVTTRFAGPSEAVRGTTHWLAHLALNGPSWPAGWAFVTDPWLIVSTGLVAVTGLAGVALAPRRLRGFLVTGLLVGLFLVTLGHTGTAASPLAEPVQRALDGALAAVRNTHKFELVVRIPLILGVATALDRASRAARRQRLEGWVVPVVVTALLVSVSAPALAAGLPRRGGYEELAQHWVDAANWLDTEAAPGSVLVVPAAGFAELSWGVTMDEPLQALSQRPFAVRDAVPLGSAGATRVLDGVEDRLRNGDGEGLRRALRDAGVRWVIVRNDLRTDHPGPLALLVHQALADGGLRRARTFGPPVATPGETPTSTVDERTRLPYPALEAYDVGAAPQARVVPLRSVARVAGGPEDVSEALGAAGLGLGAAVVGADATALPEPSAAPLVLTDGNRRREVDFGRAADNASPVLAAGDPGRSGRRVTTYDPGTGAAQTVREGTGDLLRVRASSSAADAGATLRLGPATGPQAVVDGDPDTAWVSGRFGPPEGEWVEVTLRRPVEVPEVGVRLQVLPSGGAPVNRVEVRTDTGRLTVPVRPDSRFQTLPMPSGATARIRVTARGSTQLSNAGFAVRELTVPGQDLGTALMVPPATPAPSGPATGSTAGSTTGSNMAPAAVVLRASGRGNVGCARVGNRPLCTPLLRRVPEAEAGMRRGLDLSVPLRARATGSVVARPGAAAERLLAGTTTARVTASSRAVRAAAARPGAAADGNLGTAWIAAATDETPQLTVTWPKAIRTTGIQLVTDEHIAASRPTRVRIALDGRREIERTVDATSRVRWPATGVRRMTVRFVARTDTVSVDSATGLPTVLPVGISELRPLGARLPRPPVRRSTPTGVPCGFGPTLRVGNQEYPTRVDGTVGDILDGRRLRWRVCGDRRVDVPAGRTMLEARQSAEFVPVALTLRALGERPRDLGANTTVPLTRTSPTELGTTVPAGSEDRLLVVAQNHGRGWVAHAGGRQLVPVRVNGWQQGWIVPAGVSGAVEAEYRPNGPYRAGLVLGLVGVLAALLVVLATRRERWPAGRRRLTAQDRPGDPATTPTVPAPAALGLGFGGLVLLAGVPGAVACLAALGCVLVTDRLDRASRGRVRRVRRGTGSWRRGVVPALVFAVGSAAYVLSAAGDRPVGESVVVETLALTAVALAALGIGPWPRVTRPLLPPAAPQAGRRCAPPEPDDDPNPAPDRGPTAGPSA